MKTANAGLCSSCLHRHEVKSGRGSTFLLCKRSQNDPAFARYPPLPVLACAGFEAPADTRPQAKPARKEESP